MQVRTAPPSTQADMSFLRLRRPRLRRRFHPKYELFAPPKIPDRKMQYRTAAQKTKMAKNKCLAKSTTTFVSRLNIISQKTAPRPRHSSRTLRSSCICPRCRRDASTETSPRTWTPTMKGQVPSNINGLPMSPCTSQGSVAVDAPLPRALNIMPRMKVTSAAPDDRIARRQWIRIPSLLLTGFFRVRDHFLDGFLEFSLSVCLLPSSGEQPADSATLIR